MTEEEFLREQLAILHREYLKAAQPYIDRLTAIVAMQPPPPIMLLADPQQIEILKAEKA